MEPCPGPLPEPKRPDIPTPGGACDTHCHVFGPADRFPYADGRPYTPPDAPLEAYLAMLRRLGLSRGVIVQGAAHGADNSAMLDALSRAPEILRGVAVLREDVPDAELRRMDRLGVRALRVNQRFNDGRKHLLAGMGFDAFERTAGRFADLGWHLQLWIDARDLPEFGPRLRRLPVEVVIDHMGYPRQGVGEPGFRALLRLLGDGGCWVKLSGAYRISDDWPDYADAEVYHRALVGTNPDRLLWGTDWPHPRVVGRMPDTGRLLDLFNAWTPDPEIRRRILVHNPARLYGFPAWAEERHDPA